VAAAATISRRNNAELRVAGKVVVVDKVVAGKVVRVESSNPP
jgi:hypothetical protein